MPLIIDGYNLLHVTGIVGDSSGPGGTFQRSREGLLNLLASSIPAAELSQTTIVFDAADAPPGLPRTLTHRGITVRYASDYRDADALIEQLIEEHHVPRSLLVVSSDHRIQRAARRRRASFIDSDRWYSELWQKRFAAEQAAGNAQFDKPMSQLSAAEVEYWVRKFTDTPLPGEEPKNDPKNPFPPGYGEDLLGR